MGSREQFLIDTSAAARLPRSPALLAAWGHELSAGLIGMCWPTEDELLYSARSGAELRSMATQFSALYTWWTLPEDVGRRVAELRTALGDAGCHRSAGTVDLLVAVTALHHGLTVLHYDRDFETLAEHSELKTRWLAEPGTVA
ncbi:PIN domain-containing protein [Kitasatospora griseola]